MTLFDLKSPHDLKTLSPDELKTLAKDIRKTIIQTVSTNGGHLASNLGAVELTLALFRAFDFDQDQLVWDVGHQCYTYKLLTGRQKQFSTLRKIDGICGFPRRDESPYDLFDTGHASTSLSSALGLARARDAQGGKQKIVAVVGDGALTGGMCYEALNDIGSSQTRMMIVLNDNGMSISGNVGAMSNYLTYMRTSKGWQNLKKTISHVLKRIPVIGKPLHRGFQHLKDHIRNFFIKDKFFTSLGIKYLGPIDGHDVQAMERVFERAGELEEPVVIHVMTKKGKGFRPAEEKPETYHGTPPFDPENGEALSPGSKTFGEAAAKFLAKEAVRNDKLHVVVAAMAAGTGFSAFQKDFPKRTIDVGIAEEHAVTMAAGMARGGLQPVVAIYDTFLQRSYDQLMEDVCAQRLPVILLMDRSGIGGEDGSSHHGIYGNSYLLTLPGMTVLAPRCCRELEKMLIWALKAQKPVAIRYPKSEEKNQPAYEQTEFVPGKWETLRQGKDGCLLAVGSMNTVALETAKELEKQGIDLSVINASSVSPLDEEALKKMGAMPYFTLEENVISGGFGASVTQYCVQQGITPPRHLFALPDAFIPHGNRKLLLERCGLCPQTIAQEILKRM